MALDLIFTETFDGDVRPDGWVTDGAVTSDTYADGVGTFDFGGDGIMFRSLNSLRMTETSEIMVEVAYDAVGWSAVMNGPMIVDDQGYGMQAAWYDSPTGVLLLSVTAGHYTGGYANAGGSPAIPCRIRLHKNGSTFTTEWSFDDGTTWTPGGTSYNYNVTPTRLGFGEILNPHAGVKVREFKVYGTIPPPIVDYAGAVALSEDATMESGGIVGKAGITMQARSSLRAPTAPPRKRWLDYALADGAVQAFEFDTTGTDTVLADKSGNNRHATLMNTPTVDQPGLAAGEKGIAFNRGQTEYVALATAGLPVGASPYAIEVVFKPNLIDTSQGLAMIGRTGTTNQGNGLRLGGGTNNAEVNNWWWGNDLSVTGRKIAAGQTYHLVAEFDGTTRRLILNGTLLWEAAASGLNAQPLNPTLARANTSEYFDGTFYKAAIYAAPLGVTKARRNYEAVLGGPPATITDPRDLPGVLAWYSARELADTGIADGAAVTQWRDRSGAANHTLSVFGGATYKATAGPDGGPCIEFVAGGFNLPDVFRGKTSGYLIVGMQSAGPSLNVGAVELTGTYTAGGQHYPYSDNNMYSAFGSPTRKDGIVQHAAMTAWHRLSMYSAPSDWALFQNGVLVRADTANTVAWRSNPQIGQPNYQAAGTWIRVAFALLLDHKPTSAEQAALERYFTDNPSGGRAIAQPVLDAVPGVTLVPVNEGAYITWGRVSYAETYEYRVDGDDATTVNTGEARSATLAGLSAGAHTFEVRGVSAAGAGPWTRRTFTPRTTYLYDAFDRPDTTPSATGLGAPPQGGPYTVQTGVAGITASEAYSGTNDSRVTFPAADDVDVQITLATPTGATSPGIIVRYASATDFYLLQTEASGTVLRLYHRTGTVWDSLVYTTMKDWQAGGATERLRVRTNGPMIYVLRNDVVVLEFTDPYWTGAKNAAGIRLDQGSALRVAEILATPGGPLPARDAAIPAADLLMGGATAHRDPTVRAYKGRDTKALDMESEA